MPNHDDRLEARRAPAASQMNANHQKQIMQACSRKIALSPEVDLSAYAAQTQGFSGADLQALVYNAHLDAIHATLSAATNGQSDEDVATSGGSGEPKEIAYTAFGGTDEQSGKILSRAEQASVTKRVHSAADSAWIIADLTET